MHTGPEAPLGEFALEELVDARVLVFVLDLHAPGLFGLVHVLVAPHLGLEDRVAGAPEVEDQVAGLALRNVEVLMVGGAVGRSVEGAGLPVDADRVHRVLAFLPEQGVALAGDAENMRARVVGVGLLIRALEELGDMAVHRTVAEEELDVVSGGAAREPRGELEVDEFGNIANWPKDFFGDQFGEIAAMSEAALKRQVASE